MPIYEYACTKCDHHFDVRHGADEKPMLSCPECAGDVRKVFHAAGIIFKGSGWYITDSAKKSSIVGESEKTEPAAETTVAKPEPKTPAVAESKN
ncbi:MAG: FmdB family zinc ribbon protein [Armatimonadota bacterium]